MALAHACFFESTAQFGIALDTKDVNPGKATGKLISSTQFFLEETFSGLTCG
jgi:hypothetical protein